MLLREATFGFGDPAFQGPALLSSDTMSETRQQRLAMLQERMAAADRKRQARLHAVRARAAARAAGAAARCGRGAVAAEGAAPAGKLMLDRVALLRAEADATSRRRPGSPRRGASPARRHAAALGAAPHALQGGVAARRARWLAQLQVAAEQQRGEQEPSTPKAALPEAQSPRAAAAERLRLNASSRRLQRLWRDFASERKTTRALAEAFVACGVATMDLPGADAAAAAAAAAAGPAAPEPAAGGAVFIGGVGSVQLPGHERFESFAEKLQCPSTLRAAGALLRRLEARLAARGASLEGAELLLKALFPAAAAAGRKVERYPVRVALVAYMIREHPEVVFNKVGDVEARLAAAAGSMLAAFEALLAKVLEPALVGEEEQQVSPHGSPLKQGLAAYRSSAAGKKMDAAQRRHSTLGQLLVAFDDEWLEYLDQFVVWKGRDAAGLEQELIGVAVKLERSMRLKLAGRDPESDAMLANADLQAMVSQVRHDHFLLHERILRLTGAGGVERLDAALQAARDQVAAELEDDAGSEASWETSSEAYRSRGPSRANSRPLSRAASMAPASPEPAGASHDDDEDQQLAQQQDQQQPEGASNEQLVWEMLYNPGFSLPVADAEAAWARAVGQQEEPDQEMEDPESMTPEQLAATVARRARAIAERAFWDSIEWRFATAIQGGGLPAQLAPLVSELGQELASLLSGAAAARGDGDAPMGARQLEEQYHEPRVLARLTSRTGRQGGGANLTAALSALEQLGRGALAAVAPARAEEAEGPFAEALRALAEAAGGAEGAPAGGAEGAAAADGAARAGALAGALAPALARALRLTMAQVKLAKLDAANARLSALAAAMQDTGAVTYLRGKAAASWKLPELGTPAFTRDAVAERLPRTAAWVESLGAAQGEAAALRAALSAAGLELSGSEAAAAAVAGGLPAAAMRTGLRSDGAGGRGGGAAAKDGGAPAGPRDAFGLAAAAAGAPAAAPAGAVRPRLPVLASSWQGAFRAGLVSLVSRDAPAASAPGLPEILARDRERLHAAQNGLQQLAVAASALLIAQQLRAAARAPAWPHEARVAVRRRLMAVLSDPVMKLSDLVTEITRLVNDGAASEQLSADEERVKGMFMSIVSPSSAAFRSVRSALSAALLAHALYGRAALAPESEAGRAAGAALARVGAGALSDDVAALGERVAALAGALEAVWGDALEALLKA